jgi:hypothetical protein
MGKIVELHHLENLRDLIKDLNRGIERVLEHKRDREYWSKRYNNIILHLNNNKSDMVVVQIAETEWPIDINAKLLLNAAIERSNQVRDNLLELEQQQLDLVLKGIATLAEVAQKIG